jgi:immune inhibitor A
MKKQLDNTLIKNFQQIQKAATASEDGQRCMMPPQPDLKIKMVKELERLKKRVKQRGIANKINMVPDDLAGLNDGLIRPGFSFDLGTPLQIARASAASAAPMRGTLNVLVVLVQFPGTPIQTPASHYDDLFFSTGSVPTGSVKEYYREVTNNLIDIQGQVIGPITLPQTINYYANGTSGMSKTSPNARDMAADTARALSTTINLAPFDNNNDGYVDAFVIVHAGTGAETNNNPSDIWSHKWLLAGNPYSPSGTGTQIYAYLTVPEDCRLGVCAHELGHLLFGFPDLYDISYKSNGIGNWCLMSGGSWNNNGLTPAHPSAWCKCNQGWVNIITPSVNQSGVIIKDVKTDFKIYKLWQGGRPGTEYFLAENRQLASFDANLPGSGLLLWHIDDTMTDNTNSAHYWVKLVQADGQNDLEKKPAPGTEGDAGDPYPGSTNNTTADSSSNPATLSYAGLNSSVAIKNIQSSGPDITADIFVI